MRSVHWQKERNIMPENRRNHAGKQKRLTAAKFAPPDWFGWMGVAAMFLLPVVRINFSDGPWFFPLLSLGEWLLLPMGAVSLSIGLLTLWKIRERTLLPLWISAVLPALAWLAAMGVSMLKNGVGPAGGDMLLSWAVHIVFPTMAFLPLLARPYWRDRLMWALAGGIIANVALIFWQSYAAGLSMGDEERLSLGGLLANQHDYGLMLAIALPLLAAWRGGSIDKNRSLAMMFGTFLLPAVCLSASYSWVGVIAASVGLIISWAAWRSTAWILGLFLCLLLFGYGSEDRRDREMNQRRLLIASATMGDETYRKAADVFMDQPFFGAGPESFHAGDGHEPAATIRPTPWYASLLGGSGLAGLGLWLVLLGELAARTFGRHGKRCLWYGGVLGGVAGVAVAGLWTDVLPEGAGALIGLLIAASVLEEPEAVAGSRRFVRRKKRVVTRVLDDLEIDTLPQTRIFPARDKDSDSVAKDRRESKRGAKKTAEPPPADNAPPDSTS